MRILVIVHRMAAARLGFPDLYAAFNDAGVDSFATGFREGSHWALKPFLELIVPLVRCFKEQKHFDVMKLLRANSLRASNETLSLGGSIGSVLQEWKSDIESLSKFMEVGSKVAVADVLRYTREHQLLTLDERFDVYIKNGDKSGIAMKSSTDESQDDVDVDKRAAAMIAYLQCEASQFIGFFDYLTNESPYSTQQGVKGAEFERVMVILDDEESKHRQYSYDNLLGLREPSKTDVENSQDGKETVFDRTRRLLYVCCSRARKDLSVVLYTAHVQAAIQTLKSADWFMPEDVHSLDDLPEIQ